MQRPAEYHEYRERSILLSTRYDYVKDDMLLKLLMTIIAQTDYSQRGDIYLLFVIVTL